MKQFNICCLLFALCLPSINANAVTHYVSTTGSGTGSGTSWADASNNLQAIINAANAGDQVWVAAGTYKPTAYPTGCIGCSTNRDYTFHVKEGVKLHGSFAGTETVLTQRNIAANPSILSGDFNDNDVVTGSGSTLSITGKEENAYHVVLIANNTNVTLNSTIDGFIIKGGNANITTTITITTSDGFLEIQRDFGGGIYISSPYTNNFSPYIVNVTLLNNYASKGGGMCNLVSSSTISQCIFSNNKSDQGGGLYNIYYSGNIFYCTFVGNNAIEKGGGLFNVGSSSHILNSIFSGNYASSGGGVYTDLAIATNFTQCVFVGNHAQYGGGMCNFAQYTNITNCTFSGNNAEFQGGGIYNTSATSIITNCIVWGNTGGGTQEIYNDVNTPTSTPTVTYSIVQGASVYTGIGNSNADPLFLNPSDPDGADNIWRTADDGLALQANSPAINAGDPAITSPIIDITDFIRIVIFDMGAYENQNPVSKIRYVKPTASGTGDGSSWANASNNLQAMINASNAIDQVWVAAGTYKPSAYPTGCIGCSTNRDFTFHVKDGIKLYGSFAGTETKRSQRHIAANPSILSGDFNDDDVVTGSGSTLSITGNEENTYHVVLASANTTTGIGVTIDGFTIRGGNADESSFSFITVNGNPIAFNTCGGIFIVNGINKLSNNTLSGNSTVRRGGGIYINNGINMLSNNTLSNNLAMIDGGGINCNYGINTLVNNTLSGNLANNYGGGMYISFSSDTNTLTNNTLTGNSAKYNGGGIQIYHGTNILTNNTLSDNSAKYGGGINIYEGINTLTNNTLSGNSADNGGGIQIINGTHTLINNTLSGNSANNGGGLYLYSCMSMLINNTIQGNSATINGGGIHTSSGTNLLSNNLFWGNLKIGSDISAGADYFAYLNGSNGNTFQYNILQLTAGYYAINNSKPYGIGAAAVGNLFAQDPLFLNPSDPDGADNIWRTADDGLALQANSPAINAGTPTDAPDTDITGFTRTGNPDIGAYEYNPAIFIIQPNTPGSAMLTASPNPFAQSNTLTFTLPQTTAATLTIYSTYGKEIAQLFSGTAQAGQTHTLQFNGEGLAPGIYILSLRTQTGIQQNYKLVRAR